MAIAYKGDVTIAFQVKDMKKSIAWYRDILGFKLLYELDDMGWCEMQTPVKGGECAVGLSQVEKPKVGGGPVPTFGVKDIDAARQELEKADVRFEGKTMEIPNMVKLATFYDPDGNTLMLSQSLMS